MGIQWCVSGTTLHTLKLASILTLSSLRFAQPKTLSLDLFFLSRHARARRTPFPVLARALSALAMAFQAETPQGGKGWVVQTSPFLVVEQSFWTISVLLGFYGWFWFWVCYWLSSCETSVESSDRSSSSSLAPPRWTCSPRPHHPASHDPTPQRDSPFFMRIAGEKFLTRRGARWGQKGRKSAPSHAHAYSPLPANIFLHSHSKGPHYLLKAPTSPCAIIFSFYHWPPQSLPLCSITPQPFPRRALLNWTRFLNPEPP